MSLPSQGRFALLFLVTILLVFASRWPFMPVHLYSFDSVNLALALKDFDPTRNQPQPPGYPLFVAEARVFDRLFGSPEHTFAFLTILISGLSLGVLYLLGKRMFSPWVGLLAAALLFVNPPFWFSGLTSPLRPHLALFSILVAYFCWRAWSGEPRYFYAASVAVGLGSGFRPELLVLLFPLWAATAWSCCDRQHFLRACLWLGIPTLSWVVVLVAVSGGPVRLMPTFFEYLFTQVHHTSVLLDPRASGGLRWAGRAVLWNALGVVPWFWAIPFGWVQRQEWPQGKRHLGFLALWFLPPFLFQLLVHIGEPDQALASIPVLCLLGAYCLVEADRVICRWVPGLPERGLVIWIVLLAYIPLFFAEFPLPQREPVAFFRGWQSVSDAILIGTYESSHARVRWVEQMTDRSFKVIQKLQSSTERPLILIWCRDGEPVWRKVSFYLPSEKIYALDESGDPAAAKAQARLWTGAQKLAEYSDTVPIRVPVPREARLVWIVGAALVRNLQQAVPLQAAPPVYYTDLPAQWDSFRWGSFEFVPQ